MRTACGYARKFAARPGTPFAAPDHRRAWRRCASAQGSGHGGQRLRGAPDRPERAAGEGAHPAQAQALSRPFAVRLEESVEMAIFDPLTGLHNRRYMASHLATLFDDASRRGKPLSVLLIVIDHFKAVNAQPWQRCRGRGVA